MLESMTMIKRVNDPYLKIRGDELTLGVIDDCNQDI